MTFFKVSPRGLGSLKWNRHLLNLLPAFHPWPVLIGIFDEVFWAVIFSHELRILSSPFLLDVTPGTRCVTMIINQVPYFAGRKDRWSGVFYYLVHIGHSHSCDFCILRSLSCFSRLLILAALYPLVHPRNSYFLLPFHAELLFPWGKVMDSLFSLLRCLTSVGTFWSSRYGSRLFSSTKLPRTCLKNTDPQWQSISGERGGCTEWIWGAVTAASGYFPFRILSTACGFTAIEFWWDSHYRAQVARDKHGFVLSFLQM